MACSGKTAFDRRAQSTLRRTADLSHRVKSCDDLLSVTSRLSGPGNGGKLSKKRPIQVNFKTCPWDKLHFAECCIAQFLCIC